MASAEDGCPPGTVFNLPDHVLIKKFLQPKVANLPIHSRHNIHDFDAYSVPPDQLVDKREHALGTDEDDGKGGHWYFFTPVRRYQAKNGRGRRRQRAVGEGYTWHSEGREKPVIDGETGRCVGYKLELSYQFRESPRARPTRLGWCMTEYRLNDDAAGLVLCRVCVSRHKTETTYESVIKAMADLQEEEGRRRSTPGRSTSPNPAPPRTNQQPTEIEHRWFYSNDDAMPAAAGAASRLHPAGFSFQDLEQPEDEMERWFASGQDDDAMPAAAGADNSLHPAGFPFQDLQQPEDEMERWLLSGQDDDALPAAADSSLHPAGFSFQDLQQPERWWLPAH
ncbi:hypothetical protein QYE76_034905 [Lolium multiflorum]|uniref:NAC domain-containing protein n=1 Tax=Lolium multiflorum TaxID=4521 RepID=A0AAD8QZY5_LOLMU|nr:hypothetical protein QYE76_034905 [Lolium multiflorum]